MSVRKLRDALVLMGAFVAVIWILQAFNWADGYRFNGLFAIYPHDVGRLQDIFTAPFLHLSWQHIESNTVPLFVLGVLAAYRGIGKFLLVTVIVGVASGLAVWLFQSSNEPTVGASGVIFGYFGYVLVRGFFDRNMLDIGIGVVAGLMYWTILQVAIPGTPGISWIGHLGGLFGGVLAAWFLRTRMPAGATAGGWTSGWTTGLEPDLGSRLRSRMRGSGSATGGGSGSRPSAPTPAPTPASSAADDLLRQLDDMGL